MAISDFERGLVAGVLLSAGHFGGDGRQPQITLRMHTRHEAMFQMLMRVFPRTKLYGPYHHGGRSYYQWMARGEALATEVLPVLENTLTPDVDGYAADRVAVMKEQYGEAIAAVRSRAARRAQLAEG
jgi:hypothetical protein